MTFGSITIEDDIIVASAAEEHLVPGITIDFYLTFYSHLKQLCKKVANKLNALTRIAPYLRHHQTRLIYSLFLEEISACAAVHMRYVMDACDRVRPVILLPPKMGTSFVLVALTRLIVSKSKHQVT